MLGRVSSLTYFAGVIKASLIATERKYLKLMKKKGEDRKWCILAILFSIFTNVGTLGNIMQSSFTVAIFLVDRISRVAFRARVA